MVAEARRTLAIFPPGPASIAAFGTNVSQAARMMETNTIPT